MIVYIFDPTTKEYIGNQEVNPDIESLEKRGEIVFFIPENSTPISPDFSKKIAGDMLGFYWNGDKWNFKTDVGIFSGISNSIVLDMINSGFLLIQKYGDWYILFNPDLACEEKYTIINQSDKQYFDWKFLSIEEAIFEADIVDGKRQPPDSKDTPITDQELEESRKRWADYEQDQRNAIFAAEQNISELSAKQDEILDKEIQKINEYKTKILILSDDDFEMRKKITGEKALLLQKSFISKVKTIKIF